MDENALQEWSKGRTGVKAEQELRQNTEKDGK